MSKSTLNQKYQDTTLNFIKDKLNVTGLFNLIDSVVRCFIILSTLCVVAPFCQKKTRNC